MNHLQLQTTNSPFSKEQVEWLNQLLPSLTQEQKVWLSGYMAASGNTAVQEIAASVETEQAQAQRSTAEKREATILYGSQTGNGQQLAQQAADQLKEQGVDVTLSSMHTYKPKQLKDVKHLLVIVSTHGEGDPPDHAITFHEFMYSRKAPKLDGVAYSVLALGDSSYEFFCQTGKDFDERLAELGGTRLFPRVDCDLDFDEDANEWIQGVLKSLTDQAGESQSSSTQQSEAPSAGTATYSRSNPFPAEVLTNINLNGRGSIKETRHLELSLEGSGLSFAPGDSVGIFPENDDVLVNQLLEATSWDPEEAVPINKKGDVLPLKEALQRQFELTVLTKPLLEKASLLSENDAISQLLQAESSEELKAYLEGRDLIDLYQDYGPWKGGASDFAAILRKMPPRLYSIASSFEAEPDEVHLTIGAVRYDAHGRSRTGVCSVECAERKEPGDTLPIFIQKNESFRLPENQEAPIIMIGPGTGVAPFRAFLEEREELGVESQAWLFFGDQHFTTDFLYQTDFQRWLQEGVLSKMDVAFSRDGKDKVYVQHRMKEHAGELFSWLEKGAYVYVCGDETRMAKDVQDTLLEIIKEHGQKSDDEANAYLTVMQQENRYLRDVY